MENLLTVAYLIAGVLFILSLGGLSRQETARQGNLYGIIGMFIAFGATLAHDQISKPDGLTPVLVMVLVGGAFGLWLARRVEMTKMPQLVAMLHSFVGPDLVQRELRFAVAGSDFFWSRLAI